METICIILTTETTQSELGITFSVFRLNIMGTRNSGMAKMLRGLGQGFHQFARLPYWVLPWVAGNEVIVKNVTANILLAFLCFPASVQSIDSSLQ